MPKRILAKNRNAHASDTGNSQIRRKKRNSNELIDQTQTQINTRYIFSENWTPPKAADSDRHSNLLLLCSSIVCSILFIVGRNVKNEYLERRRLLTMLSLLWLCGFRNYFCGLPAIFDIYSIKIFLLRHLVCHWILSSLQCCLSATYQTNEDSRAHTHTHTLFSFENGVAETF